MLRPRLIVRLVAEVVGDRGRLCENNQSQQTVQTSELGFQVAERSYSPGT